MRDPAGISPQGVGLVRRPLFSHIIDIFTEVALQTNTIRESLPDLVSVSGYFHPATQKRGSVLKAVLPDSIKDVAGSLSSQRRNEILAALTQPLRVSPTSVWGQPWVMPLLVIYVLLYQA